MKFTNQMKKIVKLKNCPNFRTLGGYTCMGGKVTGEGKLFRAACLSKLSENDIYVLKSMNILTVIDLRTCIEIEQAKNPVCEDNSFAYINIPLTPDARTPGKSELMPESLLQLYTDIADYKQMELEQIFRVIISAGSAIVFHCSAGKDRTGVVAALLLLLAGVSADEIVEDYAVSYELMKPIFEYQFSENFKHVPKPPLYLMYSEPDNMRQFLSYVKEKYRSAEEYFSCIGFNMNEISQLKKVIIGE